MARKNGWRHGERQTITEAMGDVEEDGVGLLNRWFREEPVMAEVLLQYVPGSDSPHDFRVRVNGPDEVPDLEAPTRGDAREQAFDYMENTPREAHETETPEADEELPDLDEMAGSASPVEETPEAEDVEPEEVARCIAETSDGSRCKNEAVEGSLYCSQPTHGPDDDESESESATA